MELTREIIQRMVGRGNSGSMTGGGSGGSSGGGGGGEGGGGGTSIVDWANITSKPTTISGYGITDAYISGGAIYLGGNSITPLVSVDLNGYATQQWVGQQGFLTSSDISDMATQTWVQQQGYITSSAISDMATETWVQQQGFLTSSDLSGYATQQWVGQQGFATTSQLSHYLALTGGTMEDSIVTPGSDSYGIYPETDRYGFIGKSTNWYWNIYGSRLYAEKMELYVYSSGSRSLYGGIDNNNFYLYPGTNSYKFNVDSNGYVTAQKFVKDGGTSSQFLKANGDVDSNVYLTGVTLNSNALTVTNNTVNVPIAGTNTPGVVQVGTGLTTNQDHLEVDTTVIATQAWVNSQGHVASAGALKYGGNTKAEAGLNGVTVTGQLVTTNSVVAQGGIAATGNIDIDDDLNFVRIRSIYSSQTQERYVEFVGYGENDGTEAPTAYKFDSEVRATAFKKTGSSNDYVLLGGGGTKEVIDFATWMDRPVTARGLNVAGDSTLAAPHVRMTYDYVSAGRFSMNFNGYAGDSMTAPISYIFDAPVTQSSDIRKKDIIRDEAFDVESIAKMPLVTFSWKEDKEKKVHFGTIAQEWQKVLPEVVVDGPDGMLAMDYGAAAMAAGVTACREVVRLKAEIERLKGMINNK